MSLQKDRDEFIATMTQEAPDLGAFEVADLCRLIMKDAATIQRLAAEFCSVEMSERTTKAKEQQEAHAEKRIAARAMRLGAVADFQGDPRGCCVKLKVKSGRTNDWGQVGICVPTREY